MAELTDQEYLKYLQNTYGGRGENYYRQFLRVPVRNSEVVLDWGCGLGGLLETVARSAPQAELHAVDLNPECVASVQARHPDWDIRPLSMPGIQAPHGDVSFDRLFLLDVIEHCPEPLALLRECHRLLKPGGALTLSTPDRWAYHKPRQGLAANFSFNVRHLLGKEWLDPTHVTEYTVWELRRLFAASPFARHDLDASPWRYIPWLRPPKRYYGFVVNLWKAT